MKRCFHFHSKYYSEEIFLHSSRETAQRKTSLPHFSTIFSFSLEKSPQEKSFCNFSIRFSHFHSRIYSVKMFSLSSNALFFHFPRKNAQKKLFGRISMRFFYFRSKNRPKMNHFAIFRNDFFIFTREIVRKKIIWTFINAIFWGISRSLFKSCFLMLRISRNNDYSICLSESLPYCSYFDRNVSIGAIFSYTRSWKKCRSDPLKHRRGKSSSSAPAGIIDSACGDGIGWM